MASTIRKLPAPRAVLAPRDVPAVRTLAVTEETPPSKSDLGQAPPSPSSTTDATSDVTREPPRVYVSKPAPNSVFEPLSAARYRIQLNASPQLKAKLEQARDLLSHSNPSGDLAAVIERALDLLLDRTLKRRFAQTNRPRASRGAGRKVGSNAEGNPELVHENSQQRRTARRHIANATKREIAARDDLRCTFVGSDGQRCGARRFTQIHHDEPWARRGDDSATNLRILCASHNRLLAEQDFGRELVANRVQNRRGSPGASQAGPAEREPRR